MLISRVRTWTVIGLAASLLSLGARAQTLETAPANPIEWSASVALRMPGLGDFDVYESGWALEVQYRNWLWDVNGLAFSVGIERWSADEDSLDWAGSPSGELTLFTLGASWVGLVLETESDVVTVEAGLRFHLASSDIELRTDAGVSDVDVGNGVTGMLGLGYERRLTETVSLAASVAYKPDLLVGDAEAGGNKLRDNKLESWGVQLGLRWRL